MDVYTHTHTHTHTHTAEKAGSITKGPTYQDQAPDLLMGR